MEISEINFLSLLISGLVQNLRDVSVCVLNLLAQKDSFFCNRVFDLIVLRWGIFSFLVSVFKFINAIIWFIWLKSDIWDDFTINLLIVISVHNWMVLWISIYITLGNNLLIIFMFAFFSIIGLNFIRLWNLQTWELLFVW